MATLRQDRRYGLSCAKLQKNTPNTTIYHVKLTDTAIRTLEAYQNLKGSLPNQPSICFKGSQGYIKIPAPTVDSPAALRIFSFYLSSDNKDNPQASFDCIHQHVSGEHLEAQGSIQDKITVCATDESYQMTRERMSQVEKDIWSHSAIEIKPGATHPSKRVKIKRKQGLPGSLDGANRHSPSNKRVGAPSAVAHKPLRERVIHLLALKPYRTPELLLWLERERASSKDKAELSAVLDEVARLNPKNQSFSLKDDFYKHVQRDWPGYLEEEKQLIYRLLARKLQPLCSSSQVKTFQSNHSFPKTTGDSPSQLSPLKNLSVKRPVPSNHQEPQTPKKQRLIDNTSPFQTPSTGHLGTSLGHGSSGTGGSRLTNEIELEKTNCVQQNHNSHYQLHKLDETNNGHKHGQLEPEPLMSTSPKFSQTEPTICTDQQLANSQHKKKKSKKHKEKEQECLKRVEWVETSPDLKHYQENVNDHEGPNSPVTHDSSQDLPEYLLKYNTIANLEQRHQYKEDFSAEYDEYKDLHERIGKVTEMFIQLGSKIKTLSPGTKEYKVMEDQILQKYRKYKKKFPYYQEEKKRCEYLHQKLSHIKALILDFDRTHVPS
ncbi:RNA polymerase II elongation factor ELL2 [Trichomycterus rosablanca]|uniref:RNA polymerase II elongation factor ELL2 n=1 Tax=Trichomycterus rosablanca TaxID=2290929 RepID=UPI002F358A72